MIKEQWTGMGAWTNSGKGLRRSWQPSDSDKDEIDESVLAELMEARQLSREDMLAELQNNCVHCEKGNHGSCAGIDNLDCCCNAKISDFDG